MFIWDWKQYALHGLKTYKTSENDIKHASKNFVFLEVKTLIYSKKKYHPK